jgi:hypothetical protein
MGKVMPIAWMMSILGMKWGLGMKLKEERHGILLNPFPDGGTLGKEEWRDAKGERFCR